MTPDEPVGADEGGFIQFLLIILIILAIIALTIWIVRQLT